MTKQDFIRNVSDKANISQKATRELLDAVQEVVYEELKNGGEITLLDAVTLIGKEVPERTARNPQTGETIVVPRHLAPKAKFGQKIKNYLKDC